MRYVLVNVSTSNLQVDLYKPNSTHKNDGLHRVSPFVALAMKKGSSIDILPHFGGSLEEAHAAVKHSRDVLHLLKPSQLSIYVCNDKNERMDPDKLLSPRPKQVYAKKPPKEEVKGESIVDEVKPEGESIVDEVKPEGEPIVDEVKPEGEPIVDEVKPEGEPIVDEVKPEINSIQPSEEIINDTGKILSKLKEINDKKEDEIQEKLESDPDKLFDRLMQKTKKKIKKKESIK